MIDHPAKPAVKPDARINRPIDGGLLLPDSDDPVRIAGRTQTVQLRLPAPQMFPVRIDDPEQFPGVLAINQPQLGLLVNPVREHFFVFLLFIPTNKEKLRSITIAMTESP